MQHIIPPLFHGSAARATLATRQEALHKAAENSMMVAVSREASPPVVRCADRVTHNLGVAFLPISPDCPLMGVMTIYKACAVSFNV